MARRHGSNGQVLIDPTGGDVPVVVASLNKWGLNMGRDRTDVTCFGDPNKVCVQGKPDIKGTLGGQWDDEDVTVFDVADGTVAPLLKLVPSTLAATFFWSGLGWVDANIDVGANGSVTIGGSFVAAAGWTREPAA